MALWVIGSLVGFVGLGVDWSQPDDVYLLFGITVPVVWTIAVDGHLIVKTGFPIDAAVALVEAPTTQDRVSRLHEYAAGKAVGRIGHCGPSAVRAGDCFASARAWPRLSPA